MCKIAGETEDKVGALVLSKQQVLVLAIVTEGFLIALALIWAPLRQIPLNLEVTAFGLRGALVLFLALLLGNGLLYWLALRFSFLPTFRSFLQEIIQPLCQAFSMGTALTVALLAGLGEELLFRGVLLFELSRLWGEPAGIVFSSFLFAYIHFIGSARKLLPVVGLYLIIGCGFAYLTILSGSLAPAILVHSAYDFAALEFIRRSSASPRGPDPLNGLQM